MSKNLTRRGFVASSAAVAALSRLPIARAADPLKVGFVYVTPLSAAGWTAQHQEGRLQMERTLGARVQARHVENVSEGPDAERVIRDLAAQGHRLRLGHRFGNRIVAIDRRLAQGFVRPQFHLPGQRRESCVKICVRVHAASLCLASGPVNRLFRAGPLSITTRPACRQESP